MNILLINGPNMQLLGSREPDVYGRTTLDDLNRQLNQTALELGVTIDFFQSNHEGDIVDRIGGAARDGFEGIVINPAAYTHTSVAIHDALRAAALPAIEVHISNINSREEIRHRSITASACVGSIAGLGTDGYHWALRALVKLLSDNKSSSRRRR